MGHVPPGALRVVRACRHLQGRQHRGAPGEGALTLSGRSSARGRRGEDLAAAWYEDHGYTVVARNWRCRDGEIDLIARTAGVVVFCEVKARTTDAFGSPAEAVTPRKQAQVRRLAARWLAEQSGGGGGGVRGRPRFDVAAVRSERLEVLEAAF